MGRKEDVGEEPEDEGIGSGRVGDMRFFRGGERSGQCVVLNRLVTVVVLWRKWSRVEIKSGLPHIFVSAPTSHPPYTHTLWGQPFQISDPL